MGLRYEGQGRSLEGPNTLLELVSRERANVPIAPELVRDDGHEMIVMYRDGVVIRGCACSMNGGDADVEAVSYSVSDCRIFVDKASVREGARPGVRSEGRDRFTPSPFESTFELRESICRTRSTRECG